MDVILLDDSLEEKTPENKDQKLSKLECDNDKKQSSEAKESDIISMENGKNLPDKTETSHNEEKMEEDDLLNLKDDTKIPEEGETEATKEEEDKLLASDEEENKKNERCSDVEEESESEKKKIKELKAKIKTEDEESQESQNSTSSSNSSSSSVSNSESETKVKEDGNSENCDRKRPAESCESSVEPKRSRLDIVIGKLGSQIGIKPELLKEEPDEDMSDTEEPDSEMTESKSEGTTTSVTEDEEDTPKTKLKHQHKKKRIRVTPKVKSVTLKLDGEVFNC